MKYLQRWRQTTIANQILSGSSGFMAVGTLALAVAAGFQHCTTKEQTSAIKDQLKTMRDQTSTMQRQLDTFNDQASSMREQTNTLKDSLGETRKAANAAVTQADASLIQAKTSQVSARAAQDSASFAEKTVEATREATFTANRAYLSIRTIHPPRLVADKASTVDVDWDNDGNSPGEFTKARYVIGTAGRIPLRGDCNPDHPKGTDAQKMTMQPHTTRTQRIKTADREFPKEVITAIENARRVFFICGEVQYRTINQVFPYRFCSYWDKDANRYFECKDNEQ